MPSKPLWIGLSNWIELFCLIEPILRVMHLGCPCIKETNQKSACLKKNVVIEYRYRTAVHDWTIFAKDLCGVTKLAQNNTTVHTNQISSEKWWYVGRICWSLNPPNALKLIAESAQRVETDRWIRSTRWNWSLNPLNASKVIADSAQRTEWWSLVPPNASNEMRCADCWLLIRPNASNADRWFFLTHQMKSVGISQRNHMKTLNLGSTFWWTSGAKQQMMVSKRHATVWT